MATIVNNPGPSERVIEVERTNDAAGGWAVAVIVLIAVILALFGWMHYHRAAPAAAPTTGPSINVTLPGGGGSDTSSDGSAPAAPSSGY